MSRARRGPGLLLAIALTCSPSDMCAGVPLVGKSHCESGVAVRFSGGVYYRGPYYSRQYLQAFRLQPGQKPLLFRLQPWQNYAQFRPAEPIPGLTNGSVEANVYPYRYTPGFRKMRAALCEGCDSGDPAEWVLPMRNGTARRHPLVRPIAPALTPERIEHPSD